ncbi:MAG TPA: hypothetical protein VF459_13700 [Caulobacteraceae bacterium]
MALGAAALAWLSATTAQAASSAQDPGVTSIALTPYVPTPAAPGALASIGARLDLGVKLQDFQTSLQAAVESAPGGLTGGPALPVWGAAWTGETVRLTTTWTPSPVARLDASVTDQLRRDLAPANPFTAGGGDQVLSTRTLSAQAAATLTPFKPIALQLGGSAASGVTDNQLWAPQATADAATGLRTDTARLFAGLTWRPVARLSLNVGDALESRGVAWRGAGVQAASFAYPAPHLTATLTPWSQARWTVTVERAISALDPAQFAAFAQAEGLLTAGAFQPDREWRSVVSLRQSLPGAVTLSATLTQARLESVTDLGPVGQTQAPTAIGGGSRRAIDVSVAAPLDLPFLPSLTLSGRGSWRASSVTDPFTGVLRPLSGEVPYRAQLSLGGALAQLPITWALKAQVTGPSSLFQMSEVDTLSIDTGLGGSLAYRAGYLVLGLQVDNLVGGSRSDISQRFSGSRASGARDGTAEIHGDSRAVRITLSKAL